MREDDRGMEESELLEKSVWSDGDFDQMGWHDAAVHAVALVEEDDRAELLFDIDYIVRWVDPVPPSPYFTFYVAPATLVFANVSNLKGDLDTDWTGLEMDGVDRLEPESAEHRSAGVRPWVIEGPHFELNLLASGFRQYFRRRPVYTESRQRLTLAERGGLSFDCPLDFPE
jgi:hypothetical protein